MVNETMNLVSASENQQSDTVTKNAENNSKNDSNNSKPENNNNNFHNFDNNFEESSNPSKRLKIDEENHDFQNNSNLQTLQPANVKLEQPQIPLPFNSTGQSSSSGTSSAYVSPNNNYGFNPYGLYFKSGQNVTNG